MAPTEVQIRKISPAAKPQKLFDAGGLFLLGQPTGSKLWRLKYGVGGKARLLALGAFDDVTLKQARAKRDEARKLMAVGLDPSQFRKAEAPQRRARAEARWSGLRSTLTGRFGRSPAAR